MATTSLDDILSLWEPLFTDFEEYIATAKKILHTALFLILSSPTLEHLSLCDERLHGMSRSELDVNMALAEKAPMNSTERQVFLSLLQLYPLKELEISVNEEVDNLIVALMQPHKNLFYNEEQTISSLLGFSLVWSAEIFDIACSQTVCKEEQERAITYLIIATVHELAHYKIRAGRWCGKKSGILVSYNKAISYERKYTPERLKLAARTSEEAGEWLEEQMFGATITALGDTVRDPEGNVIRICLSELAGISPTDLTRHIKLPMSWVHTILNFIISHIDNNLDIKIKWGVWPEISHDVDYFLDYCLQLKQVKQCKEQSKKTEKNTEKKSILARRHHPTDKVLP